MGGRGTAALAGAGPHALGRERGRPAAGPHRGVGVHRRARPELGHGWEVTRTAGEGPLGDNETGLELRDWGLRGGSDGSVAVSGSHPAYLGVVGPDGAWRVPFGAAIADAVAPPAVSVTADGTTQALAPTPVRVESVTTAPGPAGDRVAPEVMRVTFPHRAVAGRVLTAKVSLTARPWRGTLRVERRAHGTREPLWSGVPDATRVEIRTWGFPKGVHDLRVRVDGGQVIRRTRVVVAPRPSVEVPVPPTTRAVASGPAGLWVAAADVPGVPTARSEAWDGAAIERELGATRLIRIDPRSRRTVSSRRLAVGVADLAVGRTRIWGVTFRGGLVSVDAQTGVVRHHPGSHWTAVVTSGGNAHALREGRRPDTSELVRLPAATGAPGGFVRVPAAPRDVVLAGCPAGVTLAMDLDQPVVRDVDVAPAAAWARAPMEGSRRAQRTPGLRPAWSVDGRDAAGGAP